MHATTKTLMVVASLLGSPPVAAELSPTAEEAPPAAGAPFDRDPFDELLVPLDVPADERAGLAAELAATGRASFEEHAHESAARQLEASYRLVGDPAVLYLLVQALERMGEVEAAAERLERYLEEAGDLDSAQRSALEGELAGMRRRFAAVSISTEPEGAEVLLDGRGLGRTPLAAPIVLSHGSYSVLARLEGYRDATRGLVVAGGEPVDLFLRLEPAGRGRDRLALDIALWTSVGIAAAGAVAFVVTSVVASRSAEALRVDADPSSETLARARSLVHASYGLGAATGAVGLTALGLGIHRIVTR